MLKVSIESSEGFSRSKIVACDPCITLLGTHENEKIVWTMGHHHYSDQNEQLWFCNVLVGHGKGHVQGSYLAVF